MVQNGQITLYTYAYSPFCDRVLLALKEAKADYTVYAVDVMNRPKWYTEQVNPVGKVPAIAYGGPRVNPEEPSPESFKLRESSVILEFLADLFPEAGLLPADPVLRAKARLFALAVDEHVFEGFKAFFIMRGPVEKLLDGLAKFQEQLPAQGFAVGDKWTIADMAAAPFLARVYTLLEHDLGVYPAGEGPKTLAILRGERYARLNKYMADLREQPSFKDTWDEAVQVSFWKTTPFLQRS